MPTLIWHGHSCFEIMDSKGKSIVLDPHDGGSIGLRPPKASADAVLITHEHFDHNAYRVVAKESTLVYSMREREFEVLGHKVRGIRFFHDKNRGRRRGIVIAYLIDLDGVRFLHLGDIGHIPSSTSLPGNIDVMMVPVGGTFTINAREAKELINLAKPKAAIPMHYWMSGINLPLAPIDTFLNVVKDHEIIKLPGNKWEIIKNKLLTWEEPRIVLFRYEGY